MNTTTAAIQASDTADTLNSTLLRGIRTARAEHTPHRADRPALAGRYVLPSRLDGVAVWREHNLIDEIHVNGRRYYVLSAKAMQIRSEITAN